MEDLAMAVGGFSQEGHFDEAERGNRGANKSSK
jgi:hypothetical protein